MTTQDNHLVLEGGRFDFTSQFFSEKDIAQFAHPVSFPIIQGQSTHGVRQQLPPGVGARRMREGEEAGKNLCDVFLLPPHLYSVGGYDRECGGV